MKQSELLSHIHQVLKHSISAGARGESSYTVDSERFFKLWFPQDENAFFFLFRHNALITNVQFAELLTLIKLHHRVEKSGEKINIHFSTKSDFCGFIKELADEVIQQAADDKALQAACNKFAELYYTHLERVVIVDCRLHSCSIYIPSFIDIDLPLICAESGYIHSCGRLIFGYRYGEITSDQLIDRLTEYVDSSASKLKTKNIPRLIAYTINDFPQITRDQDPLNAGIVGTMFDRSKVTLNRSTGSRRETVSDVLAKLANKLSNKVKVVYGLSASKEDKRAARIDDKHDHTRTIWLISDQEIEAKDNRFAPVDKKHAFICYDQLCYNYNPLAIFEENTPGWIANTGIPHSLVLAMINYTRPWWPNTHSAIVGDPFIGTGCTLLETQQFDNVWINGIDINPISPIVCGDNAKFFSLKDAGLRSIQNTIKEVVSILSGQITSKATATVTKEDLEKLKLLVARLIESDGLKIQSIAKELHEIAFDHRIIFYIILRARREQEDEIRHKNKRIDVTIHEQVVRFGRRLDELLAQRKFMQRQPESSIKLPKHVQSFWYKYSTAYALKAVRLARFADLDLAQAAVRVADASDLQEESCHLIVTDPPYGQNTDEDVVALSGLWRRALRSMICALQDGGQLVLFVPDASGAGKRVETFTQYRFVTNQVIALADELGRFAVMHATIMPSPGELFRPPFYWTAKNLSRKALHFRIYKQTNQCVVRSGSASEG